MGGRERINDEENKVHKAHSFVAPPKTSLWDSFEFLCFCFCYVFSLRYVNY